MTPYASIVIPTHDRAATLPHSIRSALSQSVRDIEILVTGDGCTPQVREIAESFARTDPRVRFLDLPKAPLRGAANRHTAVMAALSSRIFYSDDDDLLLPSHVKVLGRALDDADVVDTPAVTVHTDGTVSLGLHDSANPLIRRLLLEERHKAVFDTHLAHRKAAYLEGAGGWAQAKDRRVVLHLLKEFAANPRLTWKTLVRITALSFHGMCRFGMPEQERAAELGVWAKQIAHPDIEGRLRDAGSYAFHGLSLLLALRVAGGRPSSDELIQLLDGPVAYAGEGWKRSIRFLHSLIFRTVERPPLFRSFFASQAAERLFGRPQASRVLDDLLDARLGPHFPTARVISIFVDVFPGTTVSRWLADCRPRPAVSLAAFHLKTRTATPDQADMKAVETAMESALPWTRFFFGLSVAEGLAHARDLESSWAWSEKLRDDVPDSRHAESYWRLRERLASARGLGGEARRAHARAHELAESVI